MVAGPGVAKQLSFVHEGDYTVVVGVLQMPKSCRSVPSKSNE